MASCLGLHIEDGVVKYAKLSKERDQLKVDSFGVKFSDRTEDAINQIIEETYSYKIPIYVNVSKEEYKYFAMFGLLNKVDLKKAIKTEFDSYCVQKGYNANSVETRYALTNMLDEKDKLRTIFLYVNKVELNRISNFFKDKRLEGIIPTAMAVTNLIEVKRNENELILNLDKQATLTIVINGSIYSVKKLENGIGEVLENINMQENSTAKVYEICKNTTIYTQESQFLDTDEKNSYLDEIVYNLSKVVQEIKDELEEYKENFERFYITGTGAIINNIDLYFQECFINSKCEVIKPFFLGSKFKNNIKDYIEVNSAIAVGMQGLGYGIKEMNFKKENVVQKYINDIQMVLSDFVEKSRLKKKKDDTKKKTKIPKAMPKLNIKMDYENAGKWLTRLVILLASYILIFGLTSMNINNQINKKKTKLAEAKQAAQEQVDKLTQVTNELSTEEEKLKGAAEDLKKYQDYYASKLAKKNAITTLLNEIMYIIPEEAVIESIDIKTPNEDLAEKQDYDKFTEIGPYHAVINVNANKYEYLGYFKARIREDNILTNVISSKGQTKDGIIHVTIEGDLP